MSAIYKSASSQPARNVLIPRAVLCSRRFSIATISLSRQHVCFQFFLVLSGEQGSFFLTRLKSLTLCHTIERNPSIQELESFFLFCLCFSFPSLTRLSFTVLSAPSIPHKTISFSLSLRESTTNNFFLTYLNNFEELMSFSFFSFVFRGMRTFGNLFRDFDFLLLYKV